ncbi:unnamed protein product [Nippostrongylus brasiliensis]|uniref:Unspecific monooxygenase n=1 Tax=Nippostrongylus brasiliensis TaxID=27835 RepID=A0A0N4Y5X0_NIPBR|nr:unnamed protein product [Nippostrongylus brasiliensis]
MNLVHLTVKDTSVGHFNIPADTLIFGEIHHVLAHSSVYKDAHEFRPERFLMEDGIMANKEAVEQFCPFSIGKRQCTGEASARVELFVGLITLPQHYGVITSKYIVELGTRELGGNGNVVGGENAGAWPR